MAEFETVADEFQEDDSSHLFVVDDSVWECPICQKEVKKRGKSAHVSSTHGLKWKAEYRDEDKIISDYNQLQSHIETGRKVQEKGNFHFGSFFLGVAFCVVGVAVGCNLGLISIGCGIAASSD